MLTRIEIDGFKSFDRFGLDLPPFLVVLGQNASGKSNLFDAIQLLRRLVSAPTLLEAFADTRGNLVEQFHKGGNGIVTVMRFAAEMLLEPTVTDSFDQRVEVQHRRVRYELDIELKFDRDMNRRVYVSRETAYSLDEPTVPFLETVDSDDGREFVIHPEGQEYGLRRPAKSARATVLAGFTSVADFPSLFAIRSEMESWRFLQLDPVALRKPSPPDQVDGPLASDGANLASVLHRIEESTHNDYGSSLDEIAVDLVRVVRGVSRVGVSKNASDEWEAHLVNRDGRISARVASDGTLRVLALLAALYDPLYRGLMCFEEPENGIFPERLRTLIGALKEIVTNPISGEPRAQLILSSHSPLMLFELDSADIVVMDWVTRIEPGEPGRGSSMVSRVRALTESSELETLSRHEQRALPGISRDEARELLGA